MPNQCFCFFHCTNLFIRGLKVESRKFFFENEIGLQLFLVHKFTRGTKISINFAYSLKRTYKAETYKDT